MKYYQSIKLIEEFRENISRFHEIPQQEANEILDSLVQRVESESNKITQLFESPEAQILNETPATNSELIEFYSKHTDFELNVGNQHGARYNLYMLIQVMNVEIMKKHCGK